MSKLTVALRQSSAGAHALDLVEHVITNILAALKLTQPSVSDAAHKAIDELGSDIEGVVVAAITARFPQAATVTKEVADTVTKAVEGVVKGVLDAAILH